MDAMVMQRQVVDASRHGHARRSPTGIAGGVALTFAALFLLALMPGYAGAGASSGLGAPAPLPAPAPSYGASDAAGLSQP